MALYDKEQFPARYRNGVFIAFHGSWNRAPYAQKGYNVVFQALADEKASGRCEIFADGFAGSEKSPDKAAHRPTGIAVGPDGSLYVSDDVRGRIYRIAYRGGAGTGAYPSRGVPDAAAPAGPMAAANANPPEELTRTPACPEPPNLPIPEGATREMVVLGDRIFHGQVGGATCTGCHGSSATGSPLGPNLTDNRWFWSDGSLYRNRGDHSGRRDAPEELSCAHAGDGGSASDGRSGLRGCGLCLGPESASQGRRSRQGIRPRRRGRFCVPAIRLGYTVNNSSKKPPICRACVDEVNLQYPVTRGAGAIRLAQQHVVAGSDGIALRIRGCPLVGKMPDQMPGGRTAKFPAGGFCKSLDKFVELSTCETGRAAVEILAALERRGNIAHQPMLVRIRPKHIGCVRNPPPIHRIPARNPGRRCHRRRCADPPLHHSR